MKRYVWRRLDPQKRMMAPQSVGGRGGVYNTGGGRIRGISNSAGPSVGGGGYRRPVYGQRAQ